MTTHCLDQTTTLLRESGRRGHEGIVYFVGLTDGTTTTALYAVLPGADATPGSVDVSASELGKIIRSASDAGLQVVGQLHTHPSLAYHSPGDLTGMRIRYPGYFSIVVPDYGAGLPSLRNSHTLMWAEDEYQEIEASADLMNVLAP